MKQSLGYVPPRMGFDFLVFQLLEKGRTFTSSAQVGKLVIRKQVQNAQIASKGIKKKQKEKKRRKKKEVKILRANKKYADMCPVRKSGQQSGFLGCNQIPAS